jgi:hypothetical protein
MDATEGSPAARAAASGPLSLTAAIAVRSAGLHLFRGRGYPGVTRGCYPARISQSTTAVVLAFPHTEHLISNQGASLHSAAMADETL